MPLTDIEKQCWICDTTTPMPDELRNDILAALDRYYKSHSLIYKEDRYSSIMSLSFSL